MKKILIALLVIVMGLAFWYFVIKKNDYRVTFKVKGTPEAVYHHILMYSDWDNKNNSFVENSDSLQFKQVKKKIRSQDTTLLVNWKLKKENDSVTKVIVDINSGNYSFANKLKLLQGETVFSKAWVKNISDFQKTINDFNKKIKVRVDGLAKVPAMQYAYVSGSMDRQEKAKFMMTANVDTYPKIRNFRTKKDGHPFIKVKSWDIGTDQIDLDFGFPLKISDSVLVEDPVKLGTSEPFNALKATYYGNYAYSDQAWFALLDYARTNNIKLKNEVLEIFYDNPMQGGDDTKWKAEIFMPVAE